MRLYPLLRGIANASAYLCDNFRWKKWVATKSEVGSGLPPLPVHISLYLSYLAKTAKTSAPILEAVCPG